MPTDTARERATDLLRDALSFPPDAKSPAGVPRSVAASIVNEIVAAVEEDRDERLDQLTRAVLSLAAFQGVTPDPGVISPLAAVADELEKTEFADAERLRRGDRRDG